MSQVDWKWMTLLVAMAVLRVSQAIDQGSTCKFCYMKQPPTAVPDCNPFAPDTIKLGCVVEGPIGAALEIKWFFQPLGTNTTRVTTNPPHNAQITSVNQHKSSTIRMITSTATLVNLMTGDYWCQVFHDGTPLLISQMIGISGTDDYGREDECLEGQLLSADVVKCADIPLPSSYIQTAQTANSTSCPLTDAAVMSTVAVVVNSSLRTSSQPPVTPTSAASPRQNSNHTTSLNRVATATNSNHTAVQQSSVVSSHHYSSMPHTLSGSIIIPIASNSPSNDLASLSTHEDKTWLFVVIGLSGMFLFLIIVLVFVFIVLCLSGPVIRRRPNKLDLRNQLESTTSPVSTEPPSRPLTSMTIQTDLCLGATLTANGQDPKMATVYDPLDQDYEDIDDEDDIEDSMMVTNPRYHEQGPTVHASLTLQPIYTEPTGQYSEIGNMSSDETRSIPTHGYGKLDHSANRPRQTYNPRVNSPLLSGYRKLDHTRSASTSAGSTLPTQAAGAKSPGYANISVTNTTGPPGPHHFRSMSLPESEYNNLNSNSNNSHPDSPTTPVTPNPTTPAAVTPTSKKYANFAIIEVSDEASEEQEHRAVSRNPSEDYQMLSDATTIDRSDPIPDLKEEYEFLPICVCEDMEVLPQSPDIGHHGTGRDLGRVLLKRQVESSLGRELEDQMSIVSHSSSDFTGPFFFPHMVNIEGHSTGNKTEQERHIYRALELSTMEPKKGYATVNIKEN